ncbi:hypothetical protein PENSPDRAFT_753102 [Peniophora sp. CONT]|nr:hypothetical protein PENSPDRAFT_753102 [Peniophora sp. CONT]
MSISRHPSETSGTMDQRILKQITVLSEPELKDMLEMITDAFGDDDHSLLSMLGGDLTLRDGMFAAEIRATLLEGAVYVVEVESQVVALALWFRKPMILFQTDAQRALGFDEWFDKLPEKLQRWWAEDYPQKSEAYQKTIISQEELDKMWFCNLMVTRKDQHNQGHATFVMDQLTAKARASGEILGICTANEVNVPKYKAMGYTERGRLTMGTVIGEVTNVWFVKG